MDVTYSMWVDELVSAGISFEDAIDTVDHWLLPASVREAREQQIAMRNYAAGFGVSL